MRNSDQSAFPLPFDGDTLVEIHKNAQKSGKRVQLEGLTKREYAAIMAMQGLLANSYYAEAMARFIGTEPSKIDDALTKRCLEIADNLLEKLEKPQSSPT